MDSFNDNDVDSFLNKVNEIGKVFYGFYILNVSAILKSFFLLNVKIKSQLSEV